MIQEEELKKKNEGQIFFTESNDDQMGFPDKLNQISVAIENELELYNMLRDLKKEKNQNKRLPLKRK